MRLAFGVLAGLLLLFTLIPLSASDHWMVRGFDFPRLQLLLAALVILGVALVLLDTGTRGARLTMLGLLIVILWQGWWVVPYTRLVPNEVLTSTISDETRRIRILNANVLTTNREAHRLLALIAEHQPDVVITLESDAWWQAQLDTIEADYPYAIKYPLDNLYGMHVYSRLPLRDGTVEFLVEDQTPSIHVDVELRSGDQIRLHVMHPAPPSPTENEESTARDRELVMVGHRVRMEGMPSIVAGDLNDVAWSRTTREFRRVSGMLDPRVGRGMYNTYNAMHWFMRWPLDHIFHGDDFTVRRLARLDDIGSDHFPLLSELQFEPAAVPAQEGLER